MTDPDPSPFRAPAARAAPASKGAARGIVAYLVLTFVLTWIPCWLLRDAWSGVEQDVLDRLLASTLLYAVTMGWQPLFAVWVVRRWVEPPGAGDEGLRPAEGRFLVLAGTASLLLVLVAMGVALVVGRLGGSGSPSPPGPGTWIGEPPSERVVAVGAAFLVTFSLLWTQALGEEVGWRGFLLRRLMARFGPWSGLVLHGFAWGLWYAPVFLLATGSLADSALRSGGFVLTCSLLGALLGWLRIESGSVLPTTFANAILTLAAGLPFLLQGCDVGIRGALFGPPGWVPLAVAVGLLALGPWKRTIEDVRPFAPRDRSPVL